jgi:hypothetical protein
MCASCNMTTKKGMGYVDWDRRIVLVECLVHVGRSEELILVECLVVLNCIIATVIEIVMTKYNLRCVGRSGLQAFL